MKKATLFQTPYTSRLAPPKFSVLSDADFMNVVSHNAIKWCDVKQIHLNSVKLGVRGSEKDFDFKKDLEKMFNKYFPELEVIPYQAKSRYVCEVLFRIRYVFINKQASFLTTHFHVADSRFPISNIYTAFSEDVIEYDAIGKTVKEAMCKHLESFKKDIAES